MITTESKSFLSLPLASAIFELTVNIISHIFVLNFRPKKKLANSLSIDSFPASEIPDKNVELAFRAGKVIAVIENFLTADEVAELIEAGRNLHKGAPEKDRKLFFASIQPSDDVQYKESYFLDSSNKVHYFFENGALDANGNLIVDPSIALNKVGHGLHILHPTFKKFTFDDRVRKVATTLGYRKPAVPQSMYIFKNPGIGAEVKSHQDASYTYTEPNSLVTLWIPLEDATVENGCLWFAKRSHKNGLKRRLIRNPDKTSDQLVIYDRPYDGSADDQKIPCPVKEGSLVIIHGFTVHSSEANTSARSRHAYSFLILETDGAHYSEQNWSQYPKGESFPAL